MQRALEDLNCQSLLADFGGRFRTDLPRSFVVPVKQSSCSVRNCALCRVALTSAAWRPAAILSLLGISNSRTGAG